MEELNKLYKEFFEENITSTLKQYRIKKRINEITIKKITIKKQEFEVYYEDCEEKLTYGEAIEYCESLGGGWRLPTRKELLEMDEHKDKLSLKKGLYWSSTENSSNFAWVHSFTTGSSDYSNKFFTCRVRAVRTI